MLYLKTLLRTIILPPAGPLLVVILGVLLQRYRPRLGQIMVLSGVAALWVLSLSIVSDGLSSLTQHYGAFDVTRPTEAQAVVILGGGGFIAFAPEYGGPSARFIMLERVTYGAYVARKTALPLLITGNGSEMVAMRETLARNFDLTVRWEDRAARDTFENAANSASILLPAGIRKIILVTHGTHMWRSVHEFEEAGFEVQPAPIGLSSERDKGVGRFIPQASALLDSSHAIYEMLGEPARRFMAFTHLRRHSQQITSTDFKSSRNF